MNCSLKSVLLNIVIAIALLSLAIALSYWWPTAYPLFVAAAAVVVVALKLIPSIKNGLSEYAECRETPRTPLIGAPKGCSISYSINHLGQAASILSAISFAAAGALQIAALAAFASIVLAWLGVALEAAVVALVYSGQVSCGAVILLLIGVRTDANAYKRCMDRVESPEITLEE